MSFSPLVSMTKISPNRTSPRKHKIDTITIHCYVGQASIEDMAAWLCNPSAEASVNYGIGTDGRVIGLVDENDRSWCSSNKANDHRAITIECASDKAHPYAINDKVYASLINLCADICKRNGIKELKWKADKSLIGQVDKQNMTVHRWFANKACVPTYSEVLTRGGWVPLEDIEIGDEIACADLDNLKISFEEVYDMVPIRYQDTYTNNDLTATKDHRMVYSHQQNKTRYRIEDFKHLLNSGTNVYIPLAGYSNFEGLPMTDDMLRFLVAVQADGHYMYDIRKADGTAHRYGVEFHLIKPRKIEAIKEIIESIELDYKETHQSNGSVKIRIYNQEGVNIAEDICEKFLHNKNFTWEWLYLSPEQADIFLNEILFWDGCSSANLYTSKVKINLDVVNAIAAINGVGSRVSGSNVQFRSSPYITLGENSVRHNRQNESRHTRVTCVSVKTGVFLMRQNGKTFIIGNCPGDYIYSRLGQIAAEVNEKLGVTNSQTTTGLQASELKNLSEADVVAKVGPLCTADQKKSGILASVTMAQFILESGYGKTDLAQNANNCFGMKTSLSGNSWSGSTWDGKSKYTKVTQECYDGNNMVNVTADFRKYPCIEDSIGDHSAYLLGAMNGSSKRYSGLKGCIDHKVAVTIIKSGGYATDPNYVNKLLNIIDRWDLKKYDADSNGAESTEKQQWYRVRKTWTNESSQKGAYHNLDLAKKCADENSGYSVYDESGKVLYTSKKTSSSETFQVRVKISNLNIRTGPGTNYATTGHYTGVGTFTIVEVKEGKGSTAGWGRLKSGAGWISLDYATRI